MSQNQSLLQRLDEVEILVSLDQNLVGKDEVLELIRALRATIDTQSNISLPSLKKQVDKFASLSERIDNKILRGKVVSLATAIFDGFSKDEKSTTNGAIYGDMSGDPSTKYPRNFKKPKKVNNKKPKKPNNDKTKEK